MTNEAGNGNTKDDPWGIYTETVCYFRGETDVAVDLRKAISEPVANAFTALGLGVSFGILTAFNPRGEELVSAANDERQSQLEAELVGLGLPFVRVDCCSPDQKHCESSVAVSAERGVVIEIARRWDQLAIFWWDGSRFWLYGIEMRGERPLP